MVEESSPNVAVNSTDIFHNTGTAEFHNQDMTSENATPPEVIHLESQEIDGIVSELTEDNSDLLEYSVKELEELHYTDHQEDTSVDVEEVL